MSLHTEPKKLIKQKNNSSTSVWVGAFETWRTYKKPLEKHQKKNKQKNPGPLGEETTGLINERETVGLIMH